MILVFSSCYPSSTLLSTHWFWLWAGTDRRPIPDTRKWADSYTASMMTKELEADFSGFLSATQRQVEDQKGNKHNWLKYNRLHKCIYHNETKIQIKTKNEKYLCYVLETPFFFCLCILCMFVCGCTHMCARKAEDNFRFHSLHHILKKRICLLSIA